MTNDTIQAARSGAPARRDYDGLRARLLEATRGMTASSGATTEVDRDAVAKIVIAHLWETLGPAGVSWVGIYTPDPDNPAHLLLGHREPKPACSPIELHGVCGQSFTETRAVVVGDVASLGSAYIACDPADRSELVLPLLDQDGSPWGVLDLDSHETHAFGVEDVTALRDLLIEVGLTHAHPDGLSVLAI